jgi:lipopolysaccharide biosynthesis regulator YciM
MAGKTLCKWKKDEFDKRMDALKEIVSKPRYVCRKCGRVADKKKWLCKPDAL